MSINNIQTNNNMNMFANFNKLSSGKRINSASDDAAGLAIAEKLSAMINGLEQGSENTADMQNLLQTAEGGLNTINDSLLRVRELSVQASNGIYSAEDTQAIQFEIDHLLDHVQKTASNTQFNNQKLLDGSFSNKNTASSADGTGLNVNITDTGLESLGLSSYNVTGEFDISVIDNAISKVNESRSSIGAYDNRLGHTISSNDIGMLNQMQSRSNISDADMAKASMKYNNQKLLQEYQMFSQKQKMQQMGAMNALL